MTEIKEILEFPYTKEEIVRMLWGLARMKSVLGVGSFEDYLLVLKIKFFMSERELTRRLLY